jgi:hypothetical protein
MESSQFRRQGAPKIVSLEDIIKQIRQATDEELNNTVAADSTIKKRSV